MKLLSTKALNIYISSSSFFIIDPDVFLFSHVLFLFFVIKNCSADQTRRSILKYLISSKQSVI